MSAITLAVLGALWIVSTGLGAFVLAEPLVQPLTRRFLTWWASP